MVVRVVINDHSPVKLSLRDKYSMSDQQFTSIFNVIVAMGDSAFP